MAKTSKGVILSQASQIKSDYSFALIKATADNKSLVQDASSAELKVNALVEYSKDSQWDPKKLTSLGFPAGCFLIVDLCGQDIHAADLITNLALVRQYGYQAGVIDDLSTLDGIKVLKANQIYLINSGKTNDDQDASLNGNEITDGSGKLAVGMSVKWQRDYTNVDVSGDHAGFVGMGQDTLLKGGNAFGYSTNGRDFNAVITPKGLIFRRPDAERMWRLLKPNEIADINSTVGDKVKKEVDSATAEIPAAVSAANSAVSAAESAVATSKVNSDAIAAQSEAISEAKSAMDSTTAEIQQTAGTINESITSLDAKYNTTVTQVQSLTASIDGLQSTVKDKADKSQITQLSNLVQSKVSTSDFTSKASQLSNDINARVTKGDLLSQINLEAGQTLIQSKKIFLDADTVAFSGKAFIPSAAITSLDADKITSGYIKVPMSDGNGNSVQVSNNGVDILSNNKESKLFNANRGIASVHIDAAGMGFGATTNGAYEQLGALSVLLDNTDGSYEGMTNHNGIGYVVEAQQQYGYPYGGDFFSLARSIKGPPSYYNGFLYEATGSGKHEIGSHFFDPIWIHPWGADNYIHATWVSWTAWDNNEKYPAIVQAGSNMGGICFPKSGEVTLFTASGKSFTPSQWKGTYTGYQHGGAGNAYHDPSQGA